MEKIQSDNGVPVSYLDDLFEVNEISESVTARNTRNTITPVTLLKVRKASEVIEESKNTPIPKMMFSELLNEGELCVLYGETGAGKSILAVQIADSISKGNNIEGFKNESEPQLVGYLDCELSDKQFENRYSNNYSDHYHWDDNMLRIGIDSDNIPEKDFEKQLMNSIEDAISQHGIKFFIIDNITYLDDELDKGKKALPIIKSLKSLKRKYGLTMLVLGHTPKRDSSRPIVRNDLAGSRNILNFIDSAFAIGESSQDKSTRYIKQIKERDAEKNMEKIM